MKALLLNTSYYPNVGGVENSFRSISHELNENGWMVDIVASNNSCLDLFEKIEGANVYRYKQEKNGLSLINLIKLLKNMDVRSYDVVISRSVVTCLALRIIGFDNYNFVIPGVYKFQNKTNGYSFAFLKYKIHCFIEQYVLKNAKNLFVFSSSMNKQVSQVSGRADIQRVIPGVNNERFKPINIQAKDELRNKYDVPLDKFIIVCVGRFVTIKNFSTVIESMKFLPENFMLILVGEGPELSNYKEIIKNNSLEDKVRIFGKTQLPEHFYNLSDLFCMPSVYEPFGQVLLEATCSGLPIVALDSSLESVDTASKEIYAKYPDLIKYVKINSPTGFAEALLANHLNESNILAECRSFGEKHTWISLVNKMKFNADIRNNI